MGTLIEGAVSVADVAKQVKRPAAEVQREAAELGLFVGEDWAGRPALSAADAAALTSGVHAGRPITVGRGGSTQRV